MSIHQFCEEVCSDQSLKIEIADNMQKYGGSFVMALSRCVILADRQNLFKLVETFTNYFLEYLPGGKKQENEK